MSGTMWKEITAPGSLKQISYDGNKLVGVTDRNEVFIADSNLTTDPNWNKIDGAMKHVVVCGDVLYAVNSNSDIYYGSSVGDPEWVCVYGKLTQIHYDGEQITGVNTASQIFTSGASQPKSPADWQWVQGGLIHVVVKDGTLFGVNVNNQIFSGNSKTGGNGCWILIPGLLKQICYDGVKVAGVNSLNQVWIAEENIRTAANWHQLDGLMKYVELFRDDMFGVDPAGKLFYKSFATKPHKSSTPVKPPPAPAPPTDAGVEYVTGDAVDKYVIYVDGKEKYVSKEEFDKANS